MASISHWHRLVYLCAGIGLGIAAIALIRDTAYNGHDFAVFWRTARHVLDGQPAYSVARDGAMVFKYPPWIVPVFFPLGLLSLGQAAWLWGGIEIASLVLVFIWLAGRGVNKWLITMLMVSYWGLWVVHSLDGQIVLPILAASLWGYESGSLRGLRLPFLTYVMSTKIFTLFALLGEVRKLLTFRTLFSTLLILGLLSLPALWTTPGHRLPDLLKSWAEAANSGQVQFGVEKVLGPQNQSLTALALRVLGAQKSSFSSELLCIALVAGSIGTFWGWFSRRLPSTEKFLGWLALTPVIHPLPWFHLFILTFPLTVWTWDQAIRKKAPMWLGLIALSTVMISLLTEKTLGTLGALLEWASIKSWGTLLLAGCALILPRISLIQSD